MADGIGDRFQAETKYFRDRIPGGRLDWGKRPGPYKVYPQAPKVKLPAPDRTGGVSVWEAVGRRRSVRDFRGSPMGLKDLSQILWASQGVTKIMGEYALRSAPSAGALYPIETYLSVQAVEGVERGIHHYGVLDHELELLQKADFREAVASAALDQDFLAEAAVVFAWTAVFARSKWKYKERAYRYVYLDAGHIAQNAALAAAALGLGSCQIAALYDDEVNAVLGVDGKEESIVYMTAVGRPA
ncbi:MAG: SagB-type dehydrogenase domain protein [Candidatus Aminicenantes bacterium]|nr:SagB-type dehydrogenase domain protein [Candidatus Aminicenantes bacterium]